jgi:hypothetical protein
MATPEAMSEDRNDHRKRSFTKDRADTANQSKNQKSNRCRFFCTFYLQ